MRCDKPVVDIIGMRGRIANPVEARQFGQPADEFAETPVFPIWALAAIGIYILAQKGDLASPGFDRVTRLGQDLGHRARVFGTTRVGYDAKAAKLVASFLDCEKGGHPSGR